MKTLHKQTRVTGAKRGGIKPCPSPLREFICAGNSIRGSEETLRAILDSKREGESWEERNARLVSQVQALFPAAKHAGFYEFCDLNARPWTLRCREMFEVYRVLGLIANCRTEAEKLAKEDSKEFNEKFCRLEEDLMWSVQPNAVFRSTPELDGSFRLSLIWNQVPEGGIRVEGRRIRRCPICADIFWAGRKDQPCCSKKCNQIKRTREWRAQYPEKYKIQRGLRSGGK